MIRIKAMSDQPVAAYPMDMEKDEAAKKAKEISHPFVQYGFMGDGFVPATSTIPVLPTGCYELRQTMAGTYFSPMHITTDELIVFPGTKLEEILHEIERFWGLKKKFDQYGFIQKRGILLWGEPGCGKTGLVMLLTNEVLKRNGIVIVADNPFTLLEMLPKYRQVEPERPIMVVMEDLDTMIGDFGEKRILSVLDGENQIEGVCFVATSNYPERLAARITNRPSRFDMIIKIDSPNAEARTIYFMNKVKTTKAPDGTDLIKATEGLSFAHLREIIVGVFIFGYPASKVIERMHGMSVKPDSSPALLQALNSVPIVDV